MTTLNFGMVGTKLQVYGKVVERGTFINLYKTKINGLIFA